MIYINGCPAYLVGGVYRFGWAHSFFVETNASERLRAWRELSKRMGVN